MIDVATDAVFLNALFNHPKVRPWVADSADGDLDLTPVVRNHLALVGEFGATCYVKFDSGIWEVHTAVLPEGRGAWAKQFADTSVRWMFTATDAVEILTRVPKGHIAAKALTLATGFRHQFDTPPECRFRGEMVSAGIYSLMIQDWVMKAPDLEERGAKFHDWLNRSVGKGTPHEPDPAHNRVVGAAVEMIAQCRHRKACVLFNRHALSCRHAPVILAGEDPVQIKFDAGILTYADGGFRLEAVH